MPNAHLEHLRQHLLTQGAPSLSELDLLTLVLGSSNLARALACASSRWPDLGQGDLLTIPRINPQRTAQVLALVELSRRITSKPLVRGQPIRCCEDVDAAYGPRLFGRKQEVFVAISLDARHQVIAEHELFRGSLTGVEVHPRELFRALIQDGAVATLLLHNHPSGNPAPSHEDHALCRRLCNAGGMLGIEVLDFVILADREYTSFQERGCMPEVQP